MTNSEAAHRTSTVGNPRQYGVVLIGCRILSALVILEANGGALTRCSTARWHRYATAVASATCACLEAYCSSLVSCMLKISRVCAHCACFDNPPALNASHCCTADAPSTSGRRVVISRHEIPLDLLVARHDPRKVPNSAVCSSKELRQVKKDAAWAQNREQLLAAAAAGFHVALFAWNLAFWGFEGMPPDR